MRYVIGKDPRVVYMMFPEIKKKYNKKTRNESFFQRVVTRFQI